MYAFIEFLGFTVIVQLAIINIDDLLSVLSSFLFSAGQIQWNLKHMQCRSIVCQLKLKYAVVAWI